MFDISKVSKVIKSNDPISVSLEELKDFLITYQDRYNLDLDPDFQRSHVWDTIKQEKFVEYILRGGIAPALLFNRFNKV